jgi:indolepyruvate ferredoxin oxidoreductase
MHEEELFPTRMALDPVMIAEKIGGILIEEGRGTEEREGRAATHCRGKKSDNADEIASRLPYFCSGCPHNTSTKVPEGSRAYAGIGCHFMVQWMDRETQGFTHMGGEGANWIGEAPFSTRGHVFQNLGDGTYNHSGVQAIRAALAADVNITYKILFNDAVAMTGGQHNDGGPEGAADRAGAEGDGRAPVAVVYDAKEDVDPTPSRAGPTCTSAPNCRKFRRKFREIKGVSAIVYIQTCAAEKRRRRKRGQFPDPDKRVFINTDVCEGCGDCGVQSNCVSIVPVETELGRKRAIDQSSCNKDYSCVNGFCPSFVTVEGAKIRKAATASVEIGDLPEPVLPVIRGTHNVVVTGVGGTGVVTVGAILAMAAHVDGKGAGMMEMAGLAQKGGAVTSTAGSPSGPRTSARSGWPREMRRADRRRSGGERGRQDARAPQARHGGRGGQQPRDRHRRLHATPSSASRRSGSRCRFRRGCATGWLMFDASELARVLMGDSIYSNMIVFGAAWQRGLIPVGREAILKAIELNGAAVERNQRAFEIGRWAALASGAGGGGADAEGRRAAGRRPRTGSRSARRILRLSGAAAGEALPQDRRRDRRSAPEGGGGAGLSQASCLQGRIRGGAASPVDAREGGGRVRGRPEADLPPRAAAPQPPRSRRAPEEACLRGVDRAALSPARADEGAARHALRRLRLHRRAADGARI